MPASRSDLHNTCRGLSASFFSSLKIFFEVFAFVKMQRLQRSPHPEISRVEAITPFGTAGATLRVGDAYGRSLMKPVTIQGRSHHQSVKSCAESSGKSAHPWMSVIAAFLIKLAKHMALLTCLAILVPATDRSTATQLGIFFVVIAAAVLYSVGRALQRRLPELMRFSRGGP
jgi:hypothetical protein